jgi:2-succinyl-6-hydroxy-2,4-cyclohexadiene-1-carboxylate synthase
VLEGRGTEAFIAEWEALPLFASQAGLAESVLNAQRAERSRHDARGLCRSLRLTGLGAMPSYWNGLAELSLPIRLVVGEKDDKFTAIAVHMAERLPRATIDRIAGAGHNVILERPDAIASIVSRQLEVS